MAFMALRNFAVAVHSCIQLLQSDALVVVIERYIKDASINREVEDVATDCEAKDGFIK